MQPYTVRVIEENNAYSIMFEKSTIAVCVYIYIYLICNNEINSGKKNPAVLYKTLNNIHHKGLLSLTSLQED